MSLVKPLIASGALVQVTAAGIAAPQSFYLTWSARKLLTREAGILRDWMLGHVD
jgi:hypothetical protein